MRKPFPSSFVCQFSPVFFNLCFFWCFEVGEDKDLSVMASVELKRVFPNKKVEEWVKVFMLAGKERKLNFFHNALIFYDYQISKITETSLSANQERVEMEKKRLVWKVEGSSGEEPKVVRGGPIDPTALVVELAPMEIRTFHITFD